MSPYPIDWSASLAAGLGLLICIAALLGLSGNLWLRRLVRRWASEKQFGRTVLAFGLLSALFLQIVALHDEDGWFGQSTAAWLQAIGSVAALLWAAWIFRADAHRRREDRREHLEAIGRAAVAATRYAAAQIEELKGRERVDPLWFERLQWAGELLGRVEVLETGDAELIDMVIAARSRLRQAARRAEQLNKADRGDGLVDVPDEHRQLATLHRKIVTDLQKVGRRYLAD